jgi:hypothetical protein
MLSDSSSHSGNITRAIKGIVTGLVVGQMEREAGPESTFGGDDRGRGGVGILIMGPIWSWCISWTRGSSKCRSIRRSWCRSRIHRYRDRSWRGRRSGRVGGSSRSTRHEWAFHSHPTPTTDSLFSSSKLKSLQAHKPNIKLKLLSRYLVLHLYQLRQVLRLILPPLLLLRPR